MPEAAPPIRAFVFCILCLSQVPSTSAGRKNWRSSSGCKPDLASLFLIALSRSAVFSAFQWPLEVSAGAPLASTASATEFCSPTP